MWGMVGGLDFGRTSDMEMILCVFLFLSYLLFPWLRRLGWRMCRATLKKECRLLGSLGSLRLGSVQCGALSLKVARKEGI